MFVVYVYILCKFNHRSHYKGDLTKMYIYEYVNIQKMCIYIYIYIYTRLLKTNWVKLSLNFELLVNRVMKFLLGKRLFNNNIF